LKSFWLPEIAKPESENERGPESRNTEDRDEYRSDDVRESRSLENTRGDEDIVGEDGRSERSRGKEKREKFL